MAINCSVILASCEGRRFITEQLDSIAAQLGADDEIIVSDDASTDETVQKVRLRNDPRIRITVNEKRVGYVDNFSRAVAIARGQNILFSDQDDVWLPNKVAVMCEALTRKACVASDAVVVDERLNRLHDSFFKLRATRGFTPLLLLARPSIIGATLGCRRGYLVQLLPFPPGIPHDFWVSINASIDRELEVIATPLILYRRHANAFSATATSRRRTLMQIALERYEILRTLLWRRLMQQR